MSPQPPAGGNAPGAGRLWVDRERWVPLKFEVRQPPGAGPGRGAAGAALSVQATYTRVGNRYWLPAKVNVELTMPAAEKGKEA